MNMDKELYSAYHSMQNKSKISIKLTPDERALLDVWMHDEEWNNLSGFIKDRVFGLEKTVRRRNAIVKARNAESVAIILQHHLVNLVNQYRFWRFACKKEIDKYSNNTSADFLLRSKTIQKTMRILHNRTMDMLVVLCAIADELGLKAKSLLQDSTKSGVFPIFSHAIGEKHILLTGIVVGAPRIINNKNGHKWLLTSVESVDKNNYLKEIYRYNCVSDPNTRTTIREGDTVSVYGQLIACEREESNKQPTVFVVSNAIIEIIQ